MFNCLLDIKHFQGGGYNPYGQPGGYAAPPGAFPPQNAQVSPQAQQWFAMVDRDRSGKINSSELQAALINGRGQQFSDNACKLMISKSEHATAHVRVSHDSMGLLWTNLRIQTHLGLTLN